MSNQPAPFTPSAYADKAAAKVALRALVDALAPGESLTFGDRSVTRSARRPTDWWVERAGSTTGGTAGKVTAYALTGLTFGE